eukprot:TRINITY_DN12942_c0_g1_i2.p1 TRINITY_DN12942_c0_g1~~TRINITY_DN12942_c0_g1_i2.p1  ORF type:complete len:302 (-),score=81.93 TRINITY_DN12942_c0_g1_i2:87-992(-)
MCIRDRYKIIENLQVKCPLNTPECKWVGNFCDAKSHCEEELKRAERMECPYKSLGCGEVGNMEEIKKHLESAAKLHTADFTKYERRVEKEKEELGRQERLLGLIKDNKLCYSLPGLLSATHPLSRGTNPVVFLKIKIEGIAEARLVFHLFANVVPSTAENFRRICIGTFKNEEGLLFTYKGSPIHRIIPGFMLQGGDIVKKDGTGNCSIYGRTFPDENFTLKHKHRGILSMSNSGPNSNGCQFFVTFKACPWLDGKCTVFGELIEGMSFLQCIEGCGTVDGKGTPKAKVWITDCGQLYYFL